MKKSIIWITWEKHRRTENLASMLKIPLYCYNISLPRFLKYPLLLTRTFLLLLHLRPRVLFIQNPSAFLTIEAILLKSFLSYVLVVDAHNAGVYPFEKQQKIIAKIFPFMHRYADLTIVTNSLLSMVIKKNGGDFFILPDPLPDLGGKLVNIRKKKHYVVTFICSFAADEPYVEVMKSARYLPNDIKLYVTGDKKRFRASEQLKNEEGIVLTDFLDERKFVEQLKNSDVIMDLTLFNDCLVCGAYEGTSLGVPLILSDTPVSRSLFNKGTIYTKNNAIDIAKAILKGRAEQKRLIKEICELRGEMYLSWNHKSRELSEKIKDICQYKQEFQR